MWSFYKRKPDLAAEPVIQAKSALHVDVDATSLEEDEKPVEAKLSPLEDALVKIKKTLSGARSGLVEHYFLQGFHVDDQVADHTLRKEMWDLSRKLGKIADDKKITQLTLEPTTKALIARIQLNGVEDPNPVRISEVLTKALFRGIFERENKTLNDFLETNVALEKTSSIELRMV